MHFPLDSRILPVSIAALCLTIASLATTPAAIAQDHPEDHPMVCSEGFGSFTARSESGITVAVQPVRKSGFATRQCSATLSWKTGSLPVAANAGEVDLDAFGVDLGLGPLVAAVAVRSKASDKLLEYQIYSLKAPVQKLRTLTGADRYEAADKDLDGRLEIWTDDAAAIDGFEKLSLTSYDAPPTVVLRFEKGRLLDVSAEFQVNYNQQITRLKAQLTPGQLSRFKASDGQLADRSALPIADAHALLDTKIKVLEIVWAYLYSGRTDEAWTTLATLWPAADLERIHAAIATARASGMQSRVDATATHEPGFHIRRHAEVFEAELDYEKDDPGKSYQVDSAPQEILLWRPPPATTTAASLSGETVLYMVVDAAGKVRSVKPEGKPDKDLLAATAGWKFIPAFKNGRPVASHIRYGVTANQ
jgi:hypothetical protein